MSTRPGLGRGHRILGDASLDATAPRLRLAPPEMERIARMPPVALVDPATIDTSRVLADREGIRLGNPQRFEMEQLTAIVRLDPESKLIIGYKDDRADEFWVRGHMPEYPLMPGVMICEAAAQLSSFLLPARSSSSRTASSDSAAWRTSASAARCGPATASCSSPRRPRPSPADDLRDPGLRRHQHGLPRQDHRRPTSARRTARHDVTRTS